MHPAEATTPPEEPPGTSGPPSAGSVATRGGRGALSVVAFSGGLNVVQLLSSLVLARQLAPREYGAFAIGATIVGFGRFLGDGGASQALVQQPGETDVSRDDMGRALTLQAGIAVIAAGLLIALAPVVRAVFDAPQETVLVVVGLSLALLVEIPAVVPRVRLRRRQQYQRLQVMNAVSFLVLYAVQIGGLQAGYGLRALVAGQLAFALCSVLVAVAFGGGLVRPVVRGSLDLARRGLPYQGGFIVQALFAVCSVGVVGSQLTTSELGLYTWCTVLATPLISLTQNLQQITFPALSRLHEFHRERHSGAVAMVARLQFLFVSAAVGLLCGLAVPLVELVFDERWLGGVDAARAALLGVLPLLLAALLGAALESSGRPRLRLRSMAISTGVGVVLALPLAARFGTTGGAVAIYLLVPLVDALLLVRLSGIRVTRAWLDAALVGGGTLALAVLVGRRVETLPHLLLGLAAAGAAGLALLPLVDRRSLLTGYALVRGRTV